MSDMVNRLITTGDNQYIVYSQIKYRSKDIILLLNLNTEDVIICEILLQKNVYYLEEIKDEKVIEKFIALLSI